MLTAFARFGERAATIVANAGDRRGTDGLERVRGSGGHVRCRDSDPTMCMLQAPPAPWREPLFARGHLADQLEHAPAVVLLFVEVRGAQRIAQAAAFGGGVVGQDDLGRGSGLAALLQRLEHLEAAARFAASRRPESSRRRRATSRRSPVRRCRCARPARLRPTRRPLRAAGRRSASPRSCRREARLELRPYPSCSHCQHAPPALKARRPLSAVSRRAARMHVGISDEISRTLAENRVPIRAEPGKVLPGRAGERAKSRSGPGYRSSICLHLATAGGHDGRIWSNTRIPTDNRSAPWS